MSYRSYAITVRPKLGLSDETEKELVKWCSLQKHAVMYIEMEGCARHAHIQIWLDVARLRGVICKSIQRICERTIELWDNCQLRVLRAGIKIAYSPWYLDYLEDAFKKIGDKINTAFSNPPNTGELEYYPTEEEQKKVQESATCADPKYNQLKNLYWEWTDDKVITLESVCKFLIWAQYDGKKVAVCKDKLTRINLSRNLYWYLCPQNCSIEEYLSKEDFDIWLKTK